MTVPLTGALARFVRDEVRAGTFATPSECIYDLVRARYRAGHGREAKLRALEAGRLVPLGEAFVRVRASLDLGEDDRSE